jgi:hypothetical protein
MTGFKLYFTVSFGKSQGTFGISWNPSLDCYDNQAVLNVEGKSYDVTTCELTNLGDCSVQWHNKKKVFFQLDLEDGRSLVGYTENRQSFDIFMKQCCLMKDNVKAIIRAKIQAEKEAARAEKATSKIRKVQAPTVQAAKALQELVDPGIITRK